MSRAFLLSLPALLLALPVAAESLAPGDTLPAATIQIDRAGLTPDRTSLAEGRALRIANHATGLARIEFDLRRGTGLPCGLPGEEPVAARKFLVAEGDSLVCVPPRGRVAYRVQRVVRDDAGALRTEITEGQIHVH